MPNPSKINKRRRRTIIRWGIITGNLVLLIGVSAFILINRSASQTIRSGTVNSVITTTSSLSNPLDSVSSAQIALSAAQMANLPELTAVRNQTDSENAQLAVTANDESVVAKPQLVGTSQKSKKDIIQYTVVAGDTISSIAGRFGLNAQSIRWSNNVTGEAIAAGRVLVIPPANGIVYQVKNTDTIDSIVNRYQVERSLFITVNDAESGITVGEYVWLPGGSIAAPAVSRSFSPVLGTGAHRFGSCRLSIPNVSGAYDCGYCTWWASYRRYQIGRPVPTGMGNAISWKKRAPALDLTITVDNKPRAGDVIWFNSNHVGFVEQVLSDGTVEVSEMNHMGWDVVSYRSIPALQASIYSYIH